MKLKKSLIPLKNLFKENGKRRICDNLRISAEWLSPGEKNDADSPSHRKKESDTIGVSS